MSFNGIFAPPIIILVLDLSSDSTIGYHVYIVARPTGLLLNWGTQESCWDKVSLHITSSTLRILLTG